MNHKSNHEGSKYNCKLNFAENKADRNINPNNYAPNITVTHGCLQTKHNQQMQRQLIILTDIPLPPANFSHRAISAVCQQKSTTK